jgi:hypothetical protein
MAVSLGRHIFVAWQRYDQHSMTKEDIFIYRQNPNGTRDSICAVCFATVATCVFEEDLHQGERLHVCYLTEAYRTDLPNPMGYLGLKR